MLVLLIEQQTVELLSLEKRVNQIDDAIRVSAVLELI